MLYLYTQKKTKLEKCTHLPVARGTIRIILLLKGVTDVGI